MDVHIPDENQAGQLRQEVATRRQNIDEILKHPGEWVLVQGDCIVGYHQTFTAGLEEGYKKFGVDKMFMVQEVDSLTRPPAL